MKRLQTGIDEFKKKFKTETNGIIEAEYCGLICLLRIAKDPSQDIIMYAAEKIQEFISSDEVIFLFTTLNRKIL